MAVYRYEINVKYLVEADSPDEAFRLLLFSGGVVVMTVSVDLSLQRGMTNLEAEL